MLYQEKNITLCKEDTLSVVNKVTAPTAIVCYDLGQFIYLIIEILALIFKKIMRKMIGQNIRLFQLY